MMQARYSKFRIGDLALRSAWELERARSNMAFNPAPLGDLAAALEKSSGVGTSQAGVVYMRPGYFEPLQKVYRVSHSEGPESLEGVKHFVEEATARLKQVVASGTSEGSDELVEFCLELHRAFIRRMPAEGRHETTDRSVSTEALIC